MLSLNYMLNQYETLKILSILAEGSAKPTQYHATPRELILQSAHDWDQINSDLQKLAKESLVQISQADTLRFCITAKGIEKINSMEGRVTHSNLNKK